VVYSGLLLEHDLVEGLGFGPQLERVVVLGLGAGLLEGEFEGLAGSG
jgi:hypothetical protein